MEKRFIEQTGSDTTRQLVWEQKDEPITRNTDRGLFDVQFKRSCYWAVIGGFRSIHVCSWDGTWLSCESSPHGGSLPRILNLRTEEISLWNLRIVVRHEILRGLKRLRICVKPWDGELLCYANSQQGIHQNKNWGDCIFLLSDVLSSCVRSCLLDLTLNRFSVKYCSYLLSAYT